MLAQRVATALALLALLLAALFVWPPYVFAAVVVAFCAVAGWEWARLVGASARGTAAGVALACVALIAWRLQQPWPAAVVLVACGGLSAFWLVAGVARLRRPGAVGGLADARSGGAVLAAILLVGCALALFELRLLGIVPLLAAMALVWAADIAAYFVGRAFGRRRLAPSVSPGKSWEGAVGGVVAAVAVAWAVGALAARWSWLEATLPVALVTHGGYVAAAVAVTALIALSIVGDLHESLLKRRAGVKDSGRLLPGHGGVLDRIDALLPTMPLAVLLHQLLR